MIAPAASRTLTAVVAALPEEIAPLRACLSGVETRRLAASGSMPVTLGWVAGGPVALLVSGEGDRNARAVTAEALRVLRVGRLLVTGVAGALSPDLPAGALLLADEVCSVAGARLGAPPALVRWAARTAGATRGRVVSARAIADTAEEKAALAARHGGGAPAVVDLESMACAQVAAAAGIPWLVLRAVSDTASEALPALLERCRDGQGAIRRGRVVRALLREPRALPVLLALRRRVQACARALSPAIRSLLDAWPALDEGVPGPRSWNTEELHE